MSEDLKRAREYGDAFRKYLLAALTGGIGVTVSIAGSLVGKGVAPNWATRPVLVFCVGLIVVGAGLLMGEHRSILRKRDPSAQANLPWYKMGIAWNLFAFLWFIVGTLTAIYSLNGVDVPREPISESGRAGITVQEEGKLLESTPPPPSSEAALQPPSAEVVSPPQPEAVSTAPSSGSVSTPP